MTSPIYRQCGLRIRSEVPLDLPLYPAAGDAFDVDVHWGDDAPGTSERPVGELVAEYHVGAPRGSDAATDEADADGSATPAWWYVVVATDDGYLVRFRDCGDVELSAALDRVTVRRDRAGRHDLLPILIGGTVSAMLLTLRGETVLHASAVAVDGVALAFIGHSGRGKSTMASLLCLGGARLVTDDVLRIDAGPPAICEGGAAELRLRGVAVEHLELVTPPDPTRTTLDRRVAFAPAPADPEPLPLGAIVIPSPSPEATELEFIRKSALDAMLLLTAFPRVDGWQPPEVRRRDFKALAALADQVPLYEVIVPWGLPFADDIAPRIADLVRG